MNISKIMVICLIATTLAIRLKKRDPVEETIDNHKVYKLNDAETKLILTSSEQITSAAKFKGEYHDKKMCFAAINGKYLVPTAEMDRFDFSDNCEEANMHEIIGVTPDFGLKVMDSFGHIYVFRALPETEEAKDISEELEINGETTNLESSQSTTEAVIEKPHHVMDGLLDITLFFKNARNNYMGCGEDGNIVRSNNMLDHERWLIQAHGEDQITIWSVQWNKYLSAKPDYNVVSADSAQADEIWTPQKIGDMWYFRSQYNTLLAADGDFEVHLIDEPLEEAKWELRPYMDYGLAVDFNHLNRDVFIRSTLGTRLQCRGDHQVKHIGNSGSEYVWHIIPIGDGKVNIKCQAYDTYLIVNDGGWVEQSDIAKELGTFTLESSGDKVQIRSYFGNYLRSFQGDAVDTVRTVDDLEKWFIDIA